LIIQTSPPQEIENYIHRAGRTARAGSNGVCITIFSDSEGFKVREIENQCGIQMIERGVPSDENVKAAGSVGFINELKDFSPS
jgi:ATP-dependent RNA helicase DDX21